MLFLAPANRPWAAPEAKGFEGCFPVKPVADGVKLKCAEFVLDLYAL